MILLTLLYGVFQRTTKLFISKKTSKIQLKEFVRKNAANSLSVANLVMGMISILCSLNGLEWGAVVLNCAAVLSLVLKSPPRKHVHAPEQEISPAKVKAPNPSRTLSGALEIPDQQPDTQLQILAAICDLSYRLGRVEAQCTTAKSSPEPGHSRGSSPNWLPSYQARKKDPDVLSIHAQDSPFGSDGRSEGAAGSDPLNSLQIEEASNLSCKGDDGPSAIDIISKVFSAAKIIGLDIPTEAPAPVDGVWAGVLQSQHSVSVPVAGDYVQMLRKSWNVSSASPQFTAGCRRLARAQYAPECGMGDMPPVDREMAALTSLGPDATTRAARLGNALAILLAALRKTANPEDQDVMNQIDSALVVHSQLTRDIGAAMSSAVVSRRQTRERKVLGLGGRCQGSTTASARESVPSLGGGSTPAEASLQGFKASACRQLRVGGRPPELQLHLDSWEAMVLDPWVLATVSQGYRIQFRRRPPFCRVRVTMVRDPVQAQILTEEISTLLRKDAIVESSRRGHKDGGRPCAVLRVQGAKLDDFADFTTFGIATSLLLKAQSLMDNILCLCYVMAVFIRLCFFSSGIPFMYRGLPCIYSSAILACVSLLSGGNMQVLRVTALAMILFMVNQSFYPHDRVLESQAWKKVVYAGGIAMVFCSSFPPACVYYLLWSISYILFPTALWSRKV
ncbi:hypothetical protein GJAV_G00179270 [Gymnothorax javanicus]|nr:hypothetical protein GJAV_G00179270 [Gymnothorax javanicus]